MASKKRKAPSTPTQPDLIDRDSHPKRLGRDTLTFIDIAIVEEFYANLYDPEDKSPKQVRMGGHLVKFDEDTLNTFLKTPVVLEEGASLCTYSRFALLRPDPQDILSFSNLIPTPHIFDLTLEKSKLIYGIIMKMDMNLGYLISHQISLIAQHDTSRLGFPALITTLCKATGVHSDSRSLESLSPTINLAYIKKNYRNLNDPKGKARDKRSEVPTTLAPLEAPTPVPSSAPTTSSSYIYRTIKFYFYTTDAALHAPEHPQGVVHYHEEPLGLVIHHEHGGVAWPGAQPSPSVGGGASAAQEPTSEEPAAAAAEGEDELTPPEPFYFDAGIHMAQEEDASTDQIPEPSPAPIPDDATPSAPAPELEQPISQYSPTSQVLDLNEHAQGQPQEQDI
ncbi:hypothetical protein HKD37_20G055869 [Glycine soja]